MHNCASVESVAAKDECDGVTAQCAMDAYGADNSCPAARIYTFGCARGDNQCAIACAATSKQIFMLLFYAIMMQVAVKST